MGAGEGDAAGAVTGSPLLTATNYDFAMAFPRTVDAPWGVDDADDAPTLRSVAKTPYILDAQPDLLNLDVPVSAATKVGLAACPCGTSCLSCLR